MEVRILEFRPRPSGARQGFVDVELPDLGLTVRDVVVFRSFRGWWCRMPARRVAVDESNVSYIPHLEFSGAMAGAVEAGICAAVESHLVAAGVA